MVVEVVVLAVWGGEAGFFAVGAAGVFAAGVEGVAGVFAVGVVGAVGVFVGVVPAGGAKLGKAPSMTKIFSTVTLQK